MRDGACHSRPELNRSNHGKKKPPIFELKFNANVSAWAEEGVSLETVCAYVCGKMCSILVDAIKTGMLRVGVALPLNIWFLAVFCSSLLFQFTAKQATPFQSQPHRDWQALDCYFKRLYIISATVCAVDTQKTNRQIMTHATTTQRASATKNLLQYWNILWRANHRWYMVGVQYSILHPRFLPVRSHALLN